MEQNSDPLIFKIVTVSQWDAAQRLGRFEGAPIDLEDGYIHFSTAEQVVETVNKHFSQQRDLMIVAVDSSQLGDALKWEPSRGGALFPHLYANLALDCVRWSEDLPLGKDGTFIYPVQMPI